MYYRNRYYHTQLGSFINRDPIETGANPYLYCKSNPLLFLDPLGLEPKTTGPCNIWIYAGHGIWPVGVVDPAVVAFRKKHDIPNPYIITGCGNHLGYVGCEGSKLNKMIAAKRRIPGFPEMGKMKAIDMLEKVQKALTAARALQKRLCENRKKFCAGTPKSYACGDENHRCDSVTIHVTCDVTMKVLMKNGIYQKRLLPGGPVTDTWKVKGLPTKESKSICGLSEKMGCNK